MTKSQIVDNFIKEIRHCREERKNELLTRREKIVLDGRLEGLRYAFALINTLSGRE